MIAVYRHERGTAESVVPLGRHGPGWASVRVRVRVRVRAGVGGLGWVGHTHVLWFYVCVNHVRTIVL